MKSKIDYTVKVFATGFIVLLFSSLLLFWIREICESSLSVKKPDEMGIRREPSGLVPEEFENDPNVNVHSRVSAHAHINDPLWFGIIDSVEARVPGGRLSSAYFFGSENNCMYFDKKSGLIAYNYLDFQAMPDKRRTLKSVRVFVGPEGISQIKDNALGRFVEPIIDRGWIHRPYKHTRELIVYDKKLRRFFKIDFIKRDVTKGPELVKKVVRHKPIRIGRLKKSRWLHSNWDPPKVKKTSEEPNVPAYSYPAGGPKPIIPTEQARQSGPYLPVLDESGRIDLLDRQSLEFVKGFGFNSGGGRLLNPEELIGSRKYARAEDLLAYDVFPLFLTTLFYDGNQESEQVFFGEPSVPFDPGPTRIKREYLGMFTASLSRSGTGLSLTIWNDEGREIIKPGAVTQERGPRTVAHRYKRTVYFKPSWESIFTVGKYLAEELHPPVLSLASFYTAYNFEAAAGHRALFLLPNSFIAMQGRSRHGNFAERFLSAVWWIFPSIIFSIWLSTRITKDAIVVGLSKDVGLYWIIGTLGFGLVAYITYRLTRPKITLVTCQNCGRMRRPDMDRCHRCKSEWLVPELAPPAWRVLEGAVQAEKAEMSSDEGSVADAEYGGNAEEAEETETE
jgi:hypothetical protein